MEDRKVGKKVDRQGEAAVEGQENRERPGEEKEGQVAAGGEDRKTAGMAAAEGRQDKRVAGEAAVAGEDNKTAEGMGESRHKIQGLLPFHPGKWHSSQ